MQIVITLCAMALLSTRVIAGSRNPRIGSSIQRRSWWDRGDTGDDPWDHKGHSGNYWSEGRKGDVDDAGNNINENHLGNNDNGDESTTQATGTIFSTIFITIATTITEEDCSTRHFHPSRYSSGFSHSSIPVSPFYIHNSSTSISLGTRFSTGMPYSSPLTFPLYTNSSSRASLLSTGFSTGLVSASPSISAFFTNSSRASTNISQSTNSTPLSTSNSNGLSKFPITTTTSSSLLLVQTTLNEGSLTSISTSTSSSLTIPNKNSLTSSATTTLSSLLFMPTTFPLKSNSAITETTPATRSTVFVPTTTIPVINVPAGTAIPHALLCDIHGFPIGDLFLGQLVSSTGNDITLEDCYGFCAGIFGIDVACRSIEFYPEPGTGAPRCALYGGSVAQCLDMVIPEVPNRWFDVGCVM